MNEWMKEYTEPTWVTSTNILHHQWSPSWWRRSGPGTLSTPFGLAWGTWWPGWCQWRCRRRWLGLSGWWWWPCILPHQHTSPLRSTERAVTHTHHTLQSGLKFIFNWFLKSEVHSKCPTWSKWTFSNLSVRNFPHAVWGGSSHQAQWELGSYHWNGIFTRLFHLMAVTWQSWISFKVLSVPTAKMLLPSDDMATLL